MSYLKILIDTYYDNKDMLIRHNNRLKKKRDGSQQKRPDNVEDKAMPKAQIEALEKVGEVYDKQAKLTEKLIKKELENYPIYKNFLENVKGLAAVSSAVIITSYNIHIADTPSKLCAYTGINPGKVRGRKYNDEKEIVLTNDWIDGDKLTKGYLAPYNGWLRAKMLGVIGDNFIRCGSFYKKFYDDFKNRKENANWGKSKMHRHRAAIRHMMKLFLQDLYNNWRRIEGLPVREPYQDEYLKPHNGSKVELITDEPQSLQNP